MDKIMINKPWEYGQMLERIFQEKINAVYENLKHYPGVEKLFNIGGNSPDGALVMQQIKAIQDLLNNGANYNEAFIEFASIENGIVNLALVIVAEERFNARIKSPEQWQIIGKIGAEHIEKIKFSFILAAEAHYAIVLEKVLKEGGNFDDLLTLDTQSFGLPTMWKNAFDRPQNKYSIIRNVLRLYIEDCLQNGQEIVEIMEQLKLPEDALINSR
jgi:hypothetical protein